MLIGRHSKNAELKLLYNTPNESWDDSIRNKCSYVFSAFNPAVIIWCKIRILERHCFIKSSYTLFVQQLVNTNFWPQYLFFLYVLFLIIFLIFTKMNVSRHDCFIPYLPTEGRKLAGWCGWLDHPLVKQHSSKHLSLDLWKSKITGKLRKISQFRGPFGLKYHWNLCVNGSSISSITKPYISWKIPLVLVIIKLKFVMTGRPRYKVLTSLL